MSSNISKKLNSQGVRLEGTPETGQQVFLKHDDALTEIFGTSLPETANSLMQHCLKVLKNDEATDNAPGNDERGFMLAAVSEVSPRDGIESMLAVQMAATHLAVIRSGRWLAHAETTEQVQRHYNGYTKLVRAFTAQMEALRKHRTGGKQTVTVQHVNVEGGGQAIVGNVQTGGGDDGKK